MSQPSSPAFQAPPLPADGPEENAWEVVLRDADPDLHGSVRSLVGFAEAPRIPVRRRELPSAEVPLIFGFGAPYRVTAPGGEHEAAEPREGFVAGLHDTFAVTETTGPAACVQVNLSPLAAHRLLRLPMGDLSGRVVGLADLFGSEAVRVSERLHDARGWDERFAVVQAFLRARLDAAPPACPVVARALRRLGETSGRLDVRTLAAEVGWSRKHLAARFHEQVGLAPKALARVLRFRRALRLLEAGKAGVRWSDVALDCGYYDQAHLNRDFRAFTGASPREYLRRRGTEAMTAFPD